MLMLLISCHHSIALTGCDTKSKVSTKPAALKTANGCGHELLCFFGKTELTDEIISNAF